ncbi:MAG TPA: ATP-binding cassette domain-containing protein [Candidatus Cloacimonadota bacterium]|jgi:ABC-type multidrug transport system ATPase subunit|nr:ATP-binding cassette domain-containing protein [Candidatus Cloacimonadales bacterium]HPY96966.1 ATP-binding cassette domain-containing protein [Candidatus Cloacimonadota bacterium]HQB41512.1 ATP-binding cassette domain-containing protein [Candidatus Cloacimonadota bacterium]
MLKIENFELFNHSEIILIVEKLVIDTGEFAYFNGENRSGKSLLLSSLGAVYHNYHGKIYLNNKEPYDKNYHKLVRIIQNENLIFGDLGIVENIGFKEPEDFRADSSLIDLLVDFNLPVEKNVKCGQLSQSELKCIELIRAYMQKPMMLIIDDLDNYFDSKIFDKIYDLLVKMKKQGTIIISSGKAEFNAEKQFLITEKGLIQK